MHLALVWVFLHILCHTLATSGKNGVLILCVCVVVEGISYMYMYVQCQREVGNGYDTCSTFPVLVKKEDVAVGLPRIYTCTCKYWNTP